MDYKRKDFILEAIDILEKRKGGYSDAAFHGIDIAIEILKMEL